MPLKHTLLLAGLCCLSRALMCANYNFYDKFKPDQIQNRIASFFLALILFCFVVVGNKVGIPTSAGFVLGSLVAHVAACVRS